MLQKNLMLQKNTRALLARRIVAFSAAIFLIVYALLGGRGFIYAAIGRRLISVIAAVLGIGVIWTLVAKEADPIERDPRESRLLLVRFYATLTSFLNELVLHKSAGYVIAYNEGGSDEDKILEYAAKYDNISANIDRIMSVLANFFRAQWPAPSGSNDIHAAFFAPSEDGDSLVLVSTSRDPAVNLTGLDLWTSNDHLARDGDSLASIAWRTGKTVIVADTTAEKSSRPPKFVPFKSASVDSTIRSIVGYPVVDKALPQFKDFVVGVICLDSTEAGVFHPESEKFLEFPLETFSKRIIFEIRKEICDSMICNAQSEESNGESSQTDSHLGATQ